MIHFIGVLLRRVTCVLCTFNKCVADSPGCCPHVCLHGFDLYLSLLNVCLHKKNKQVFGARVFLDPYHLHHTHTHIYTHTDCLTEQQKPWSPPPDRQFLPLSVGGLCVQRRHITKIPQKTAVRHLLLAFPPLALSSLQSALFFFSYFSSVCQPGLGAVRKTNTSTLRKAFHLPRPHSF